MDFRFTAEQEQLRQDVREFLSAELDPAHEAPVDSMNYTDDWDYQRAFGEALAARHWLAPSWPKKYGGLDVGYIEQMIFGEELAYGRAPPGSRNFGVSLLGPALLTYGTETQKNTHLPAIAASRVTWCQGYSEPEAGSDLASLTTPAERSGDVYVVNGRKTWTSSAHRADWIFLLARTDPAAPKHKGISFLLAEMDSPGIEVRPIVNMAGRHDFNEVVFTDCHIPVENLVGEENAGWYVAMTVLDHERSFIRSVAAARRTLDELTSASSGGQRQAIAGLYVENVVARWLNYRVGWMQAAGLTPNKEASLCKIVSTEHLLRVSQAAVKLAGLAAIASRATDSQAVRRIGTNLLTATAPPIFAGTNEVQRNIIATRGLGLPA